MRRMLKAIYGGVLMLAAAALAMSANAQSGASAGPNWMAEKQELREFGKRFETGLEMYEYLKEQAGGGTPLTRSTIPDWSGLWEREAQAGSFDPDKAVESTRIGDTRFFVPTAKLKGKYKEMMDERIQMALNGNIYDPISECGVPRGYPGILQQPRPWDFAILPHQTWMMTEAMNEVRRIYTDGRDHPPARMAFPSEDGDSIGFWDGDMLIVHTMYAKAGWLTRMAPYLSDKVEGVEIWQKVDDETLQADVWLYDEEALAEPWFTRQIYKKEEMDPLKILRIHFWECDNPNNQITRTEGGGSTFTNFDFTNVDD